MRRARRAADPTARAARPARVGPGRARERSDGQDPEVGAADRRAPGAGGSVGADPGAAEPDPRRGRTGARPRDRRRRGASRGGGSRRPLGGPMGVGRSHGCRPDRGRVDRGQPTGRAGGDDDHGDPAAEGDREQGADELLGLARRRVEGRPDRRGPDEQEEGADREPQGVAAGEQRRDGKHDQGEAGGLRLGRAERRRPQAVAAEADDGRGAREQRLGRPADPGSVRREVTAQADRDKSHGEERGGDPGEDREGIGPRGGDEGRAEEDDEQAEQGRPDVAGGDGEDGAGDRDRGDRRQGRVHAERGRARLITARESRAPDASGSAGSRTSRPASTGARPGR